MRPPLTNSCAKCHQPGATNTRLTGQAGSNRKSGRVLRPRRAPPAGIEPAKGQADGSGYVRGSCGTGGTYPFPAPRAGRAAPTLCLRHGGGPHKWPQNRQHVIAHTRRLMDQPAQPSANGCGTLKTSGGLTPLTQAAWAQALCLPRGLANPKAAAHRGQRTNAPRAASERGFPPMGTAAPACSDGASKAPDPPKGAPTEEGRTYTYALTYTYI